MPEVDRVQKADLVVLYTNIGRGHPSYLDGIIEVIDRTEPAIRYLKTDVFALSGGYSLAAWKLVRRLYYWGARGGLITALYGFVRRVSGSGEGGILLGLLGRDVRTFLSEFRGPVLVAHPILARILSSQNRIIYQHGELAAPAEAMASGCHKILVPADETSAEFIRAGMAPESLKVTGQCLETGLVPLAQAAFLQRLQRLEGNRPLTAALFSSGAYPAGHLRALRESGVSLYRAGHIVCLFPGQSKSVADRFIKYFQREKIETGSDVSGPERLKIIVSNDRNDENRKVAAVFGQLDLFVAAAHERTNWAVGLGLPQVIIGPHIGSYAPLNAAIALSQDVAIEIRDKTAAGNLGSMIDRLRTEGKLAQMARNGFRPDRIGGFAECVRIIVESQASSRGL